MNKGLKFNTHKNFPEDDGFGTTLSTVANLGRRLDVKKMQFLIVINTYEASINSKENQELVFSCCGKSMKDIETKGLCPWCNAENTEVIKRWKRILAQAIADAFDKGELTEDV